MEKQIKLDEKSAQEFVSAASRCNFDIDVFASQKGNGSEGVDACVSDHRRKVNPWTSESGSDKNPDSKVLRRG